MLKKKFFFLGLISFCVNVASWGQGRVLSYEDAIKLALRNGILLNQQRNNMESSQMLKYTNIAGLGPTLNASASANRIDGNFFNQQAGKLSQGLFDQFTGSLNANINIFNGFSQVNKARSATSLADAQAFYVNRSAQDVIAAVSLQYLSVLLDEELLRIARENQDVLEKQLVQVKEQVELGSKSPVDEYNQDSQAKSAKIRSLTAELTLLTDQTTLIQALLLDPAEEFEVAKPNWDPNAIGADSSELKSLTDLALKTRGDYLRALKNEEGARYGMSAMKASMYPTLSAYYTVFSAYNHQHGAPTEDFHTQFSVTNLRKYYGLNLYIPIFGGNQNLQNRYNFVSQKVLFENNRVLRQNAEILVKNDVKKAYKSFDILKRTYSATLDQLASADIAFTYETERYNLGVTDFVTYLNANRVKVQAQTDKAQAEYRLVFQRIVLEYAVGTLKADDQL